MYTPGNRVHLRGALPSGSYPCTNSASGIDGCLGFARFAACFATDPEFDTADEFRQGEFVNLNATTGQLQVNTWSETKSSDP